MKKDFMNETAFSTQAGRSMVEMLGVLAIIGVLSVSGIAGYRYGIEKYQANEIIDEVSKRAIIAATQMIQQGELGSDGFLKSVNGITYATGLASAEDDASFFIDVTGLKESVCRLVLKNLPA